MYTENSKQRYQLQTREDMSLTNISSACYCLLDRISFKIILTLYRKSLRFSYNYKEYYLQNTILF